MIYAVGFDLDDPSDRESMKYFDIEPLSPYWKHPNGNYMFGSSAYCGALFLGIL